MKVGKGSAPGKVIIAGEHSVVYGYPAIAVALGIRCNVISSSGEPGILINSLDLNKQCKYEIQDITKLKKGVSTHLGFDNIAVAIVETMKLITEDIKLHIEIHSDIPISSGLGSSAAVVVACIAAVLDLYDQTLPNETISSIALKSEKITHGTPSGIDNSVATYGGILTFQSGKIKQKELKHSIPLIIGNTRISRDTKKLVSGVYDLKKSNPTLINPILHTMGNLAMQIEELIGTKDLEELGKVLDINQGLLDSIGVGHSELSDYIWKARSAGALGAKLTGAGGGGCMIALAKNIDLRDEIVKKLELDNLNIIATEISKVGVMIGEI